MKSDTTTTALNFVLAALVILGVVFTILNMMRTRELRQMQTSLQFRAQAAQVNGSRALALANDVNTYNATAKSPELAKILQSVLAPQTQAKPTK